jgi:hypothetical protein
MVFNKLSMPDDFFLQIGDDSIFFSANCSSLDVNLTTNQTCLEPGTKT